MLVDCAPEKSKRVTRAFLQMFSAVESAELSGPLGPDRIRPLV